MRLNEEGKGEMKDYPMSRSREDGFFSRNAALTERRRRRNDRMEGRRFLEMLGSESSFQVILKRRYVCQIESFSFPASLIPLYFCTLLSQIRFVVDFELDFNNNVEYISYTHRNLISYVISVATHKI